VLSLFLSSRVVQDPPWLAEARKKSGRIDGIGLALIAVALGALQIVLDKGQETTGSTRARSPRSASWPAPASSRS
jgi:hypothetical protein